MSVNDNNLFLADFSTLNATTAMMRQLKITVAITSRGSEALERYLQDISKEEMVSTDEEVELAKRILLPNSIKAKD